MRIDVPVNREEALLLEVRGPVRRFLRRILNEPAMAEDAESETMLTLIQRFRAGLEIRRPISFALQVAWSKALEVQRRMSRDRQIGPSQRAVPHDPARMAELRDWLDSGLSALKPLDRALIHLRHAEDLSYRELSHVLGEPIGTIGRQLHEARLALKTSLERTGGDEVSESTLVVLLPLLRTFDGLGPPSGGSFLPGYARLAARVTARFTSAQKIVLALGVFFVMGTGAWILLGSGPGRRAPRTGLDDARGAPAPHREVALAPKTAPATAVPVLPAIAGRVVDESGKAVAGATVHWLPWTGTPLAWDANFATRQDLGRVAAGADGGFRFEPASGSMLFRLVATAPGFAAAMRDDVRAGAADVVMRLTAGLTIGGVVADLEGSPVGDATVTYHARIGDRPVQATVKSARDGRYLLEHLPIDPSLTRPDAGTLEIASDAHATQIKPVAIALPGARAGSLELDVWLARGSVLEGTVRDESGARVAGATVEVWLNAALEAPTRPGFSLPRPDPLEPRRIRQAKTDPSGRYRFDRMPIRIAGIEPGSRYAPLIHAEKSVIAGGLVVSAPGRAPAGAVIPLATEDEAVVTVDVAMASEVVLAGSIRDAHGAAVAGVEVRVHFESEDLEQWIVAPERIRRYRSEVGAAVTDGRGEWTLGGVPRVVAPGRLEVTASARGYVTARLVVPPFGEGARLPDIVLTEAASIRGLVVDERGVSVPGALIEVVDPSSVEQPPVAALASAVTDREGWFTVAPERAPAGLELRARAPGLAQARVALRDGGSDREVRVAMVRERFVRGFVRSADGDPVPGALVTAMPAPSTREEITLEYCARHRVLALAETVSDAAGAFALGGLPPGRVMLWVGIPWPRNDGLLGLLLGRKFAVVVPEPAEPGPVVVKLPSYTTHRGFLSVSAVDAATKAPIVHRLTGSLVAPDGMIGGLGIFAGPGLLVFHAVPAGTYRLLVEADGHPRVARDGVSVGDPASAPEIRVELGPGARVRGRVRHDGELPSGAIYLRAVADSPEIVPLRVRCGEDGSFDLQGLAPGAWRIIAELQDCERVPLMTTRPADLLLELGKTEAPLEMRLMPIERVAVRITGLFVDGDPPTTDKKNPRYGDLIRRVGDVRIRCRDAAGVSWINTKADALVFEVADRDVIFRLPLPAGSYACAIDLADDEIDARTISSPGTAEVEVPGF